MAWDAIVLISIAFHGRPVPTRSIAHAVPEPHQPPASAYFMRAIYGLSTVGPTDEWTAKARKSVDIFLRGSHP